MATIARLVIVGTAENDELIAIPTRPWNSPDDDNVIQGLGGDDLLDGGGGNDLIDGGPGDDRIQGGTGTDTSFYSQLRQAYEVFRYNMGSAREAVVRGPDGIDSLLAMEQLSFPTLSGALSRVQVTDYAEFQALNYVASHPDLAVSIGANADLGWLHYRSFGAAEDRAVTFDGLAYIASYPDLSPALGTDGRQGTLHYLRTGRVEGREVTFDGINYLASHADLSAAFGPDEAQGTLHYLRSGQAEGRQQTFSGLQYVASNDDLAIAFARLGDAQAIEDAGARHIIVSGFVEGRLPDDFDEVQYLLNNPDLLAAGLATPEELALHFILSGRAEGRNDSGGELLPEDLLPD